MSQAVENEQKVKALLEAAGFVYQPQSFGGITLHGKTSASFAVFVFEFWKFEDAGVDEGLLAQLDGFLEEFKDEIGSRIYILVPKKRIDILLPPGDRWRMNNFEFCFHICPDEEKCST